MATMMAYAAPQQYMWNMQAAVPNGHPGSWPPGAPSGYGGPPPVPPGVDPNAWKAGQWQFNPMFVPTAAPTAQAWAPHPVWGAAAQSQAAQAQQAADFNPYKRQPVPLSEEYKAQKLSANPLGLENMIPRSELEKDPNVTLLPPTTPWFWTPKELSNEDEGRTKTDGRDARDSRDKREPRERASSTYVSSASASANARHSQRQLSTPQPQQSSTSQPQYQSLGRSNTLQSSHYQHDSGSRRSHERSDHNSRSSDPRTPPSAPATVSAFSTQYQQQQQQQQSQSRSQSQNRQRSREPSSHRSDQYEQQSQRSDPRQQQQSYRQQTDPSTPAHQPPRTPTYVSSASAQARAQTYEDKRMEAFSSQETLKPTFSPSIVRTPKHYSGTSTASGNTNGTPSRRSTADDARDERDVARRLAREESISRSSPARHDSTRNNSREQSRSRHMDREYQRAGAHDSDDESPVRPNFRGPIYGPPTPTPGATRPSTNGTSRSNTSPGSSGRIPSLISTMSSLSVDNAPNSASGSSGLFLSSFSDEPAGILSPLIVGSSVPSTKSSPRDLGRSQTYPTIPPPPQSGNGRTVAEERSPASPLSRTPSKTPRPSPSQPSPRHIRSPSSVTRSRTYPTLANDPLAGEPPVIPPKPSPISRAPSPHRPSGRSPNGRNPLPPPPIPISYSMSSSSASASAAASQQDYSRSRTQSQYSSPTSYNRQSPSTAVHASPSRHSPRSATSAATPSSFASASASAATPRHPYGPSTTTPSSSSPYSQPYLQPRQTPAPPPQPQPQPAQPRKVRHGFWNRRGDHLIFQPSSSSGGQLKPYIVYAPRRLANPEELAQYPTPTEGWMNHHREVRRYDPSVPELPESLPSHGEPPMKPYDSFIRYVNV